MPLLEFCSFAFGISELFRPRESNPDDFAKTVIEVVLNSPKDDKDLQKVSEFLSPEIRGQLQNTTTFEGHALFNAILTLSLCEDQAKIREVVTREVDGHPIQLVSTVFFETACNTQMDIYDAVKDAWEIKPATIDRVRVGLEKASGKLFVTGFDFR